MPYFKEATLSWDLEGRGRYNRLVDGFSYHCSLAPMLIAALDIKREDYDFALVRKMLGIWRQAAELIYDGDYYPLTPLRRTPDKWVARQFDCPELGRGFIQAIRRPKAPEQSITVRPQALDAGASYLFKNPETGQTRELTGRALQ